VVWCLRQLLPLIYRTYYGDEDGNIHFAVWRMWFGRCFAIDDVVVVDLFATRVPQLVVVIHGRVAGVASRMNWRCGPSQ
jgi:hypothetical protein